MKINNPQKKNRNLNTSERTQVMCKYRQTNSHSQKDRQTNRQMERKQWSMAKRTVRREFQECVKPKEKERETQRTK